VRSGGGSLKAISSIRMPSRFMKTPVNRQPGRSITFAIAGSSKSNSATTSKPSTSAEKRRERSRFETQWE